MARVAALLVIVSQLILMWLVFETKGQTTIAFVFFGHPILGVGLVLGLIALLRRLRREREVLRAASEPRP